MKTKVRVWAIFYKIRLNPNDSWKRHQWVGPCGMYLVGGDFLPHLEDCLSGRPFFFRTRALARQKAKELNLKKNRSWKWVKYTVRPFILSWTEGDWKWQRN